MDEAESNMQREAEAGTMANGSRATPLKRWLPLAVLAGLAALAFAMGWHKALTLEAIAANRERLEAAIEANRLLALAAYVVIYGAAVAASIPGALVLTLAGGLLFGWLVGGLAAVAGATVGATLVFLVARSAFGDALAARAGPALARIQEGFRDNALAYLLFLRLVPVFPFFLVNLAPALAGVPLPTYVLGTFLGIIPATFAFASAGAGLDGTIAAARAEQQACLAANAAGPCELSISLGSLLNTDTQIALVLIGVVALIPVAYKKWPARKAQPAASEQEPRA